ncbi:zinc-dependent alcohol dehydrogenase [Plantibacter sp. Mn2098]|uniref:zinc-dependent alcohol dehydrogenase n=1 Tax=Plantibacter sp. Mn2098 TaxID=3395266 RepID=UPI003BCF2BDD
MRALEVSAPGRIGIVDRSVAGVGPARNEPDSVLVRPRLVGLCGTDLDIIDGGVDPAFVRYPIVLGHEWVGEVVHGDGDDGIGTAELVVAEGIVPCETCHACLDGATNLCETYEEFGFTRDGAATGLLSVPRRLIHPLGRSVGARSAVLAEPAAVVHHAIARAHPRAGARVLVIGDGTIGLLATRLVRASAPEIVVVHGRRSAQEELAMMAGADAFHVDRTPKARHYDLVIDASGNPEAIAGSFSAVRRGGSVVLLGYAGASATAPLPIDDAINREATVTGSFASTAADWRAVVAKLAAGELDLSWLVTHQYPLDDFEAAIAELRRPSGPRGKIVLIPS